VDTYLKNLPLRLKTSFSSLFFFSNQYRGRFFCSVHSLFFIKNRSFFRRFPVFFLAFAPVSLFSSIRSRIPLFQRASYPRLAFFASSYLGESLGMTQPRCGEVLAQECFFCDFLLCIGVTGPSRRFLDAISPGKAVFPARNPLPLLSPPNNLSVRGGSVYSKLSYRGFQLLLFFPLFPMSLLPTLL